ncbi:glycosyltransferase family 39 protein [Mycobacterium sp. NPDC003323]
MDARRRQLTATLHSCLVNGRSTPPVVVGMLAITFLMLCIRVLTSTYLAHDDGITLLSATCQQGRYAMGTPVGRWVPVEEWHSYWSIGSSCLETVRADLAQHDIHPPLYFWLLHLWFLVFGVSIPAAAALNLVLVLATALLIYLACRSLAIPTPWSVAVVLVWLSMMSTRVAVTSVRQYALLGTFSALLLLLLILWYRRPSSIYLLALLPTLAGGMLTQYLFAVPAAMAFFVLAVAAVRGRSYRNLLALLLVYVGAVVIFVLANPDFRQSLQLGSEQAQPLTLAAVPLRIGLVLLAAVEMFLPLDPAYRITGPMVVATVITAILVLPMMFVAGRSLLQQCRRRQRRMVTDRSMVSIMLLGSGLVVLVMFVVCVSPLHSMRPLYLYFLTPFLAVALAVAGRQRTAVVGALVVLLGFQFVGVAIATTVHVYERVRPEPLPGADTAVIVDSDRRGLVPPTLIQLPPGVHAYVATQDSLLLHPPDLSQIANRRLYYASRVMVGNTYGNTLDKRARLVAQFEEQGYAVENLGVIQSMGGAQVYLLSKR